MIKTLVTAALVSAGIAMTAGAADAKTNINIGVGIGVPAPDYYDDDYPTYYAPPPVYYYEPRPVYHQPRYRLTCGQVARNLRNNGYRNIQPQDCSGRRFSFVGWRHGEPFLISVSSRSGRVIGRRPL